MCITLDIIRTEYINNCKHKLDYNLFREKIQDVSWDEVYTSYNVSLAFSKFKHCITNSYRLNLVNERNTELKTLDK